MHQSTIDRIKSDLNNLKLYVPYYNPTIQHFQIGEIGWVMINDKPTQVIITNITDFGKGAYTYYWIQDVNFPAILKYWEYVKFWSWLYIGRFFGIKQKINPKFGAGHGVLAGRNETLFKTSRDAVLNNLLIEAEENIEDVEDILN